MAKNQSSTDDLLSKSEALASRLEKTNSNLGEKVGEMIKALALSKTTEAELKQQLQTNEQEFSKLKETLALLEKAVTAVNEKASTLEKTVETNQESNSKQIKELTQQVAQTLEKQTTLEKDTLEMIKGIAQYTKELKRESTIYLLVLGIVIIYLFYNTFSLNNEVFNLGSKLDSLNQQLTQKQSQENKIDPETTPTPESKPKANKK